MTEEGESLNVMSDVRACASAYVFINNRLQ
jgi:hypothetical protein